MHNPLLVRNVDEDPKLKAALASRWHGWGVDGIRMAVELGMPVHAYVPMASHRGLAFSPTPIEDPVIAYTNRLNAKRICDKTRKRLKRINPNTKFETTIMRVTLK